jgi:hypothetical protein
MVTHVRVGMSAALGWLVRLDRPKEELPTEPGGLRPGRESGRTVAGNQDAVPDAACRLNHAECATVTREPKQAVSGRLQVPCVTAHSGSPLSKPGHRLLPARVGSSLNTLPSGPDSAEGRIPPPERRGPRVGRRFRRSEPRSQRKLPTALPRELTNRENALGTQS